MSQLKVSLLHSHHCVLSAVYRSHAAESPSHWCRSWASSVLATSIDDGREGNSSPPPQIGWIFLHSLYPVWFQILYTGQKPRLLSQLVCGAVPPFWLVTSIDDLIDGRDLPSYRDYDGAPYPSVSASTDGAPEVHPD
jgi:hypothetical protein